MKKALSFILVLGILLSLAIIPVFADENDAQIPEDVQTQDATQAPEETEDLMEQTGAAGDNLVTTKHSMVLNGQTIDYTATTGTMIVETGGEQCEIFFIAYTRDGVEDLSERPITFTFNGGPGSASYYTDFLFMGPKRMELDEKGHATKLPAVFTDNENSVLDLTDLVFIDAVGTGYSRALPDEDEDYFIGYQDDIRTIGDFIRLYINRNKRWSSPKYVAGESYGTTRAVGICSYLADAYSMGLNGLMLISSVNDFLSLISTDGNDMPYAFFLPTFAADAWYHNRLDDKYQNMKLEEFLDEVRNFVTEEYVVALFRGRSLSADKKDEIAGKIAEYTGLTKAFVLDHNLRFDLDEYSRELLKDQHLVVGRYDGRYTGPVTSGSIYDGTSDPSTFDIDMPLIAAVNQYMVDDLGFSTDTPYIPLSLDVNYRWEFDSDNEFLAQEEIVHDCMSANSNLKVWVLCGYYDGATPFFGSEWVYDHVFLDDSRLNNLSFTYYPSGHMFYLDRDSHAKFKEDAQKWYKK
ncbi:MAG: hypothetical protein K6G22_13465 [Lachnospiraceae bacterium]|nr:hypothetical protein [Lachnospiraceae bacterium]